MVRWFGKLTITTNGSLCRYGARPRRPTSGRLSGIGDIKFNTGEKTT